MISPRQRRLNNCGFTFVEVLAALLFLAILVPTLMGALSLSSRTSVIAERSANAVQLAENKLNELVVENTWTTGDTQGNFGEDWTGYRWQLTRGEWQADNMNELKMEVFFTVQGHEHSVALTTLASDQQTQQ